MDEGAELMIDGRQVFPKHLFVTFQMETCNEEMKAKIGKSYFSKVTVPEYPDGNFVGPTIITGENYHCLNACLNLSQG